MSRTTLLRALLPLAAAAVLLTAVVALGRAARGWLKDEDRLAVAFSDIDCPAPPGLGKNEFLGEVQYLSRCPDRLHVYDHAMPGRLAAAFARHPWVEKVAEVSPLPPDRVRVRLVFRTPVLAVPQPDGVRVVDGHGVLLPATAPAEDLPTYQGKAAPPAGAAGACWGDNGVTAAAATAHFLRPHRDRLSLTAYETTADGLVLHAGAARVLWGHAPGSEAPEEPAAEEKLARLLDHVNRHGRLDSPAPAVHDLRRR